MFTIVFASVLYLIDSFIVNFHFEILTQNQKIIDLAAFNSVHSTENINHINDLVSVKPILRICGIKYMQINRFCNGIHSIACIVDNTIHETLDQIRLECKK